MQLAMDPASERIDPSFVWAARYRLETTRRALSEEDVGAVVEGGRPGVYVIWNPVRSPSGGSVFRCEYVGMSEQDIPGRLRKHLRNAHNKKLNRNLHYSRGMTEFSFDYTRDAETARELETALIHILEPVCNIQKNR